jgi:pimeloyl-ACP methyl ester carboxylesterase
MGERRSLRCIEMGAGTPALILHAFGVEPDLYRPLGELLADQARVVIPDLFDLSGWLEAWNFQAVLDYLIFTLDNLAIDRATVVAHSFGGGIALGLTAHWPDRVHDCVFVDTLGSKHRLSLAREAARPAGLLRTASRPAAISFLRSWAIHPIQLASAAVDGYRSRRDADIDAARQTGLPCHVLWAENDEIIPRDDSEEFARRLNATFTVTEQQPNGRPLTHDWVFDQPDVFGTYLETLDLYAVSDPLPVRHPPQGGGHGARQGHDRQLHQRPPRGQEQS